ncbi:hypothetical protein IG631_00914 [Alternaria alternata]|nr:hypothetical protein IG631_00914 [Alternaria alternata]
MQCALMSPTATAQHLKPWRYNGSSTQSEEARRAALCFFPHSTQIWNLESCAQTGTDSGLVVAYLISGCDVGGVGASLTSQYCDLSVSQYRPRVMSQ